MLIEVIRKGYKDGVVEDHLLANLIDSNKIIAFRRSSGWAVVGKDPVRVRHAVPPGLERRKVIQGVNFLMK